MSKIYISLLTILSCLVTISCVRDEHSLRLSSNEFKASSNGNEFTVTVSSEGSWQAETSSSWIRLSEYAGSSSSAITIFVENSITEEARTGEIKFKDASNNVSTIKISQDAYVSDPEDPKYTGLSVYKIPVIFHVLYNDASDPLQNVDKELIYKMLDGVNKNYFHASDTSQNLGIEFVLANTDPNGRPMKEIGINRMHWETARIDPVAFMSETSPEYLGLMWDPNIYVNVMLYRFTSDGTLGIATFPLVPESHPWGKLELSPLPKLTVDQLDKVRCVSINSTDFLTENNEFNPEIITTLSHELGHYFGLRHVFSEDQEYLFDCKDTDDCLDTPSYNRTDYEDFLSYAIQQLSTNEEYRRKYTTEILYERVSCPPNSFKFISTNIMDYAYSKANVFTKDQLATVRHILRYSPLIPGPKEITESKSGVNRDIRIKVPNTFSHCPTMPALTKEQKELLNLK